MSSPINDQSSFRQSTLSFLQTSIKHVLSEFYTTQTPITDECVHFPMLMDAIERIFSYGLIPKSFFGGGVNSYWVVLESLERLSWMKSQIDYVRKDIIGDDTDKARALLRNTLNEKTLGDCCRAIVQDTQLLCKFYTTDAIFRREDDRAILFPLLDYSLKNIDFSLSLNLVDRELSGSSFIYGVSPVTSFINTSGEKLARSNSFGSGVGVNIANVVNISNSESSEETQLSPSVHSESLVFKTKVRGGTNSIATKQKVNSSQPLSNSSEKITPPLQAPSTTAIPQERPPPTTTTETSKIETPPPVQQQQQHTSPNTLTTPTTPTISTQTTKPTEIIQNPPNANNNNNNNTNEATPKKVSKVPRSVNIEPAPHPVPEGLPPVVVPILPNTTIHTSFTILNSYLENDPQSQNINTNNVNNINTSNNLSTNNNHHNNFTKTTETRDETKSDSNTNSETKVEVPKENETKKENEGDEEISIDLGQMAKELEENILLLEMEIPSIEETPNSNPTHDTTQNINTETPAATVKKIDNPSPSQTKKAKKSRVVDL